jgi:uncharacterized DUF497 family protein
MKIAGFDWDEANRGKCLKHGVSIQEIEALFDGPIMVLPDHAHSTAERRLRAIAKTAEGRHVFLVFTIRGHGGKPHIRPISARYMHEKEVKAYEKANPKL